MALLALGGLTAVAIVAFVRSNTPLNKGATGLMWAVSVLWFFVGA